MEHESTLSVRAATAAGVEFVVAKVSFQRRLDFLAKLSELGQRLEFLEAGETARDRIEATLLHGEIDKLYLESHLLGIIGLILDGEPATPASLIAKGPEELVQEAVRIVKSQFGLSEEERKN